MSSRLPPKLGDYQPQPHVQLLLLAQMPVALIPSTALEVRAQRFDPALGLLGRQGARRAELALY